MSDKLPQLVQNLADAIEAKGLKITFGIQPNHLEVIERHRNRLNSIKINDVETGGKADMIYSEYLWECVGKEIGWLPFTIALHYFNWKSKQ